MTQHKCKIPEIENSGFSYCSFVGGFLAAYAIKDSMVAIHAPAGCKKRILYLMNSHDLLGDYRERSCVNAITNRGAIFGGDEELGQLLVRQISKRKPGVAFILSGCVPEMIGSDTVGIAKEAESKAGTPVIPLNAGGFKGDLFSGYADALGVIAENIPPAPPKTRNPNALNIIGYFFDRYEMDNIANISEIRRMAAGTGMKVNCVLPEGGNFKELAALSGPENNVAFPHGEKACSVLSKRFNQNSINVELPVGIENSIEFLKKIGSAVGTGPRTERFIEKELARIIPRIERVLDTTIGKRIAIFSDSQMVPGLLKFLIYLGMEPISVSMHDSSQEAERDVKGILRDRGMPAGVRVFSKEEFPACVKRLERSETDIIIGSSIELERLGHLNKPFMQLGLPSFEEHALFEMPYIGFMGSLVIANRIANLLEGMNAKTLGIKNQIKELENENDVFIRNS